MISGLLSLGFALAVSAFVDRLLPQDDWRLILIAAAGLLAICIVNAGLYGRGHLLGMSLASPSKPNCGAAPSTICKNYPSASSTTRKPGI